MNDRTGSILLNNYKTCGTKPLRTKRRKTVQLNWETTTEKQIGGRGCNVIIVQLLASMCVQLRYNDTIRCDNSIPCMCENYTFNTAVMKSTVMKINYRTVLFLF